MSFGSEITDEDMIAFKRDGFVLKKGMYSAEEISLLHDIAKGEQYARASSTKLLLVQPHLLCYSSYSCQRLRVGAGLAFASAQGVAEGRARISSSTL